MAENDSWNNGSAQNRGFSNAGNGANGMNGRSGQAVRDALFDRANTGDNTPAFCEPPKWRCWAAC